VVTNTYLYELSNIVGIPQKTGKNLATIKTSHFCSKPGSKLAHWKKCECECESEVWENRTRVFTALLVLAQF